MKKKWIGLFFLVGFMVFTIMAGEGLTAGKDFPNRPVTLYVGFGAGGGMSVMARAIASKMGEILGQPIIVLNKPGAQSSIAMDFVRRSKADGYSLVMVSLSTCVVTPIIVKVPFKTDDFEYFGQYGFENFLLIVNSNSPWKTIEELVDYAKKHPGELTYPSVGHGSHSHLVMEMFNHAAGIKTVQIPMKSGPEMLAAILGGHCQVGIMYELESQTMKEGGRLRFLAATGEQRVKWLPDVPTFMEKGYPEVVYFSWYGVAGPKGMPKEVLGKLKDAFGKTFQDEEFKTMITKFGITPAYKPPDQFTRYIYSEEKRLRKTIGEIGLKVE